MEDKLLAEAYRKGLRTERKRCFEFIDTLQNLCFMRERQLSDKIKGHDYHNGYSCALHDIRNELEALKSGLKLNDAKSDEGHSLTNTQLEINKIKKGCGKYLSPIGSYNSCGKKTPLSAGDTTIKYCEDCQAKLDTLNVKREKE